MKNSNKPKTDVQEVKRQNAKSQSGMTEFANEYATDVQEVKHQNAQSQSKKNQKNYQK
jgi:small acid-soluble spore protein E (minor gamma-type SASP)